MKLAFTDGSHIELSQQDNKIHISIAAKDQDNPLKRIINMVQLTPQQYQQLISEIKL